MKGIDLDLIQSAQHIIQKRQSRVADVGIVIMGQGGPERVSVKGHRMGQKVAWR